MRLSTSQIDYTAFLVLKAFKASPHITLHNPDAVVAAVRTRLIENLRLEEELEREAAQTLSRHRQQILSGDADYQKMLREAVRILARKRGEVI
jgi:hypothetical protein